MDIVTALTNTDYHKIKKLLEMVKNKLMQEEKGEMYANYNKINNGVPKEK